MSKITVLNPFSLDPDLHAATHAIEYLEPTLTVQADAAATDINNIVKQFGLTKMLPYGNAVPVYDDYSDIPNDFHAAQNFIIDTQAAFMHLPAEQRSRFDNDPGKFMDFIHDDANYDEAINLGFVPRKEVPPADGGVVPPSDGGTSDKP